MTRIQASVRLKAPSPHAGSTGADIATDPATQLHDPSTGCVPILSPEHYKHASRV